MRSGSVFMEYPEAQLGGKNVEPRVCIFANGFGMLVIERFSFH